MRPAGHAEIERAKADGRWDAAYDSPRDDRGPAGPAGRAATEAAGAAAFFAALNSQNRYSILYRSTTPSGPRPARGGS